MAKKTEELTDKLMHKSRIVFRCIAVVMVVFLLVLLVMTAIRLPEVGSADMPGNNEVMQRYIEKGIEETGAVNYVAGMILDYRAFDTFGESNVLFIATICVTIMLKMSGNAENTESRNDNKKGGNKNKKAVKEADSIGKDNEKYIKNNKNAGNKEEIKALENDSEDEDASHKDLILRSMSRVIIPMVMVFGIYVILNGHLSPGGGFSGGAILGAGFILCASAFGFEKISPMLNEKTIKWVTFCSLMVYCLAKSYSFFTGANHLESHIPLGTPGAILSSGLILILNICVGMVVACTMYSFYSLVKRGKV